MFCNRYIDASYLSKNRFTVVLQSLGNRIATAAFRSAIVINRLMIIIALQSLHIALQPLYFRCTIAWQSHFYRFIFVFVFKIFCGCFAIAW
jgi:hypothetical protein